MPPFFIPANTDAISLKLDSIFTPMRIPAFVTAGANVVGQFAQNGDLFFCNVYNSITTDNYSLTINLMTGKANFVQNNISGSQLKAAVALNSDIFVARFVTGAPNQVELYIADNPECSSFTLIDTVNEPLDAPGAFGSGVTNGTDTIVFNFGRYAVTSTNGGVSWSANAYDASVWASPVIGIDTNNNNTFFRDGAFYCATGFSDSGGADFGSRIYTSTDGLAWTIFAQSLGGLHTPSGDMYIFTALDFFDNQFAACAFFNTGLAFAPTHMLPVLISNDGLTLAPQVNTFYSEETQQTPPGTLPGTIAVYNNKIFIVGNAVGMWSANGTDFFPVNIAAGQFTNNAGFGNHLSASATENGLFIGSSSTIFSN